MSTPSYSVAADQQAKQILASGHGSEIKFAGTIITGENLEAGTVLGRITASGKLKGVRLATLADHIDRSSAVPRG